MKFIIMFSREMMPGGGAGLHKQPTVQHFEWSMVVG